MISTRCRYLPIVLTVLIASVACAGQLSLRFAGGDEVTLVYGGAAEVQVVWTMGELDEAWNKITAMDLRFVVEDALGEPVAGLWMEDADCLAGWELLSSNGVPFTESDFFLSALDPSGAGVAGDGTVFSTVLASFAVTNDNPEPADDVFVTFRHANPQDFLPLAENGAAYWQHRWQHTVNAGGQFKIGAGNPGDEPEVWSPYHGLETFEPLTIHLVGASQIGTESCVLPARAAELPSGHPGTQVYTEPVPGDPQSCQVVAFYGGLMNQSATTNGAADAWLAEWGDANTNAFGVPGLELALDRWNEVGFGESTVYAYHQVFDGLVVQDTRARLVVRHGPTYGVAFVAARLKSVSATVFRSDTLNAEEAVAAAEAEFPQLTDWSTPEMVILQSGQAPAVRAWRCSGTLPDPSEYESYLFFVDAADGALVEVRNYVVHANPVSGRVTGQATPGLLPDTNSNGPAETPLEDLIVHVGAGEAYTDEDGNYLMADAGTSGVMVEANLVGRWVQVIDGQGCNLPPDPESVNVTPPQSGVAFDFNLLTQQHCPPPREFSTAQVNAFVHVTRTHNFYKARQLGYSGVDVQLPCKVNEGAACNARYDPTTQDLHFFSSVPSLCVNSAYSSVITHEYGHFIQHGLGLTSSNPYTDPFGEGFADSLAGLVHDDPVVARDFHGPGAPPTIPGDLPRNIEQADQQFPCFSTAEGHECGQVLAGVWWDIKQAIQERPDYDDDQGREIARQLFTNWSQITLGADGEQQSAHPMTAIEVLTVDDLAYGDEIGSNGTPHDLEICSSFVKHGIECPGDCNGNGEPDADDLAGGTSLDCNENARPDECDVARGPSRDCNTNAVPDECDIAAGTSADCTTNDTPDECEPDCNASGTADSCDIAGGTSDDCDLNGTPDECQQDCNSNGQADVCEAGGAADDDCNFNGVPDLCDMFSGSSVDCNTNGVPDECDLLTCVDFDCNTNGVPDRCDIEAGTSLDDGTEGGIATNGLPDECDLLPCPPRIRAIYSVGYHTAPPTGWPGGEIAFYIDPLLGGIEPRVQTPTPANSNTQVFIRVTFDRAMDPTTLNHVRLIPAPPDVIPVGTNGCGDGKTVEIRFVNTNGAAVAIPSNSYRIDLTGMASEDGAPLSAGCPTFPICFATGDVNCDGQATAADSISIQQNIGTLSVLGLRPRADLNRDGRVRISLPSDDTIVQNNLDSPNPPVSCRCAGLEACVGPPAVNDCTMVGIDDCTENGASDECDMMDCEYDLGTLEGCAADLDVDLRDFAKLQVCARSSPTTECLTAFDRAIPCGTLRSGDQRVFTWQLSGPFENQCAQEMGASSGLALDSETGAEMEPGSFPAITESPPDWTYQASTVLIEITTLEGSEALTTLSPFTSYELHCRDLTQDVEGYTLMIRSDATGPPLESVAPAETGDWSETGLFDWISGSPVVEQASPGLENAFAEAGQMILMDDRGTAVTSSTEDAYLCRFTTGGPAVLDLRVLLYNVDHGDRVMYEAHGQAILAVVDTSP